MKRFSKEAGSLPTLQAKIPPLLAGNESKLHGGYVVATGVASPLSININVTKSESSKCVCTTNKQCNTTSVSYSPTATGTIAGNAFFDGLF